MAIKSGHNELENKSWNRFLTCQLVEEVALLQVELGLQCGKDSVERILGVVGGQARVVKETVIRGVMIRMEDVRIAGVGSRD